MKYAFISKINGAGWSKLFFTGTIFAFILLSGLIADEYKPTPYKLIYPSYFGNRISIPADNPTTNEGVYLGRKLFYETRLSANKKISCASCHQQENAFSDNRKFSIGVDGSLTDRHSMALVNLLWSRKFFWDGRAVGLEAQAAIPLANPHEMGQTAEASAAILSKIAPYPELFRKAFGDSKITASRIVNAISQFERTLICEVVVSGKKGSETTVLTNEKIEMFNKQDVSSALNLLPGINLSKVGARNESVVLVRGFDLRQVPVFIDGIPVYVPYDGYVDLGRFTTFDISQINVAKGFSSVAFGANTLGGAINLVSRRPVNKFEIDANAGLMNSEGYRLSLNMGSTFGKFYVQGSISQLKQQSYLLSSDFVTKPLEDGDDRNNAYRKDNKYSVKVGFTPRGNDEYAVSYMKQDGQKGNPPYVGNDPLQKARFWQWPYWNKESIYFISSTGITGNSFLKTRLYYDKFKNQLNAYDDATYSTQTKPSSFQSFYDDDTYGAGLEYDAKLMQKHQIKTFIHYKNDRHKEHNSGEPVRTFRDYTVSAGVEDSYKVTEKLMLTPGVSFNLRGSLQAQDYNTTTKQITDYPENSNNAFNVQLGAVYQLNDWNKLNASVARKSRFATIKDRYSYRMGTAIPNPDLKAEMANHYEVGYSGRFASKLGVESNVFYSRIADAIQQVNNVKPNTYQLQNTGKAEFYGAELSVKYDILNNWYAVAQYSYLHRENLSNKEIKFTDAPENKVVAYTQYSFKKRFSVLAGAEYNSARYSTSYGTKADEFAIVNLSGQAKVYRWVSVEAGVNNVFDKNYSISEGYPEPGRNLFVSLIINTIK